MRAVPSKQNFDMPMPAQKEPPMHYAPTDDNEYLRSGGNENESVPYDKLAAEPGDESEACRQTLHYETYIAYLVPGESSSRVCRFVSAEMPDLCAIAATLQAPYAITVYHGTADELFIIEEYDEPGDKGNYAGFWHTSAYYVPGHHRLSPLMPLESSLLR